MKYFYKLLNLLVISTVLISCNDSDNSTECITFEGPLGAIETPLVGTWSLTAIESNQAVDLTDDDEDNPLTDIYVQSSDCENDAVYTFLDNRSYKYEQGIATIGCSETFSNTGTWKYSTDLLQISNKCLNYNLEITLDETEFSFENNVRIVDIKGFTSSVKLTYTYTKN